MERGVPIEASDEVYWRKDGTSFPVEYSVVPIREGVVVVGAVLSFRDITERRAIERMKDEFISIVSHELRTPLTSIRGSLGLLAAGLLGPISERATRMVDIAVTNTDRLVRLINDILDIERIESGRVVMDKQWTDARDLVLRSIDAVRGTVEEARVSVVPDVEPILLRADPDRVQQTLTNLIGNAIKFSPTDSVIDVRARRTAQEVLFSVRDRGRGIPSARLETIFGRFEQVDASDARERVARGSAWRSRAASSSSTADASGPTARPARAARSPSPCHSRPRSPRSSHPLTGVRPQSWCATTIRTSSRWSARCSRDTAIAPSARVVAKRPSSVPRVTGHRPSCSIWRCPG